VQQPDHDVSRWMVVARSNCSWIAVESNSNRSCVCSCQLSLLPSAEQSTSGIAYTERKPGTAGFGSDVSANCTAVQLSNGPPHNNRIRAFWAMRRLLCLFEMLMSRRRNCQGARIKANAGVRLWLVYTATDKQPSTAACANGNIRQTYLCIKCRKRQQT